MSICPYVHMSMSLSVSMDTDKDTDIWMDIRTYGYKHIVEKDKISYNIYYIYNI